MIPEYTYENIIIVYHHNCMDGTAGGWVLKKYFETVKNIPRSNIHMIGQKPQCPDLFKSLSYKNINLGNNDVLYNIIFVDICPNIDILKKLIAYNHTNGYLHRIEIYDHHETNKTLFINYKLELEGFIKYVFDMSRCGCQIAWDEFYNDVTRPLFIDYIGQGDLWKFESEESKIIYDIICDNFKTFEKLDWLFQQTDNYFITENIGGFRRDYLNKAYIINDYKKLIINKYIESAKSVIFKHSDYNSEGIINTKLYNVWFIHCNYYDIISELGNQLCSKSINIKDIDTPIYPDFVIIVKDFDIDSNNKLKINISLRSNSYYKPHINVSLIANKYGGGGHPQASGFSILSTELTKLIY